MQTDTRFLDDLAKLAGSAFSSASAIREEIEARFRQRFEAMFQRMDLVTREEFEAVRAMAVKAREENEALAARLAALEASQGVAKPRKTRAKAAKPAA